ncbi:MAG: Tim44/TimA family putative adaptor protein [Alphaproteobacteria bacterium]
MGGGLDIIILAMVAGFVALRLVSVLGRRTGNERRHENPYGTGSGESNNETRPVEAPASENPAGAIEAPVVGAPDRDTPLGRTLSRIMVADRNFDPAGFVANACTAYEMIIEGFAAGDREVLRPLLSEDVFGDFEAAIEGRESAGRTMETKIVEVLNSEITDASLEDGAAEVTVRFKSELISVVRDSEDRIVEGNPSDTETVTDVWTFARMVKSRDPNWVLIATDSPE